MECCSLAHTSFIFGKPFYSFKVISDCLESNNNLEYRQSKAIWELKIIDIFKDILENYNEIYRFTHPPINRILFRSS